MVKERLLYMDALKLFAIFMVVMGHVVLFMAVPDDAEGIVRFSNPLYMYIYSFHMPLFMTISGYFSAKILEGKGNVYSKFQQLIVPCITLAVIFLIFGITTQNMWYLKSLFLCYFVFYFFQKAFKNIGGKEWLILIIICFLFFPILVHIPILKSYKVDFMLPFFGGGMLLKQREFLFKNKLLMLFCLFFFVVLLIFWKAEYIWYLSRPNWFPIKDIIVNKKFMFDCQSLCNNAYRYLTGFMGSFSFIGLFYYLNNTRIGSRLFELFGKYGIYSLHIYIIQTFLVELNILSIDLSSQNVTMMYFYVIVLSILFTVVSIIMAKILEKNKYINSYLFGKFK